ncbi:hypothetical protein TARUN_6408 [Trichoderma arundinaceum]|uniref:Rna-binding n=1 Tax=Trichoderma arundinaceum TaxID=490622 RepID=A0A395NIC2_TRIAR|nr:hypothetical protein TARUN_6408 [Trichoderma arundinaceum]
MVNAPATLAILDRETSSTGRTTTTNNRGRVKTRPAFSWELEKPPLQLQDIPMADELSLTANLPTGQRGYSQSPSRDDDMHGNAWDRRDHRSRPPHQPPFHADRAGDYRDAHDTRPRRSLSPHDWSRDNQGRMYSDDYHRGRHEQARGNDYGSSSSYRDRRSYNSRSPHGDYHSRSRSRSPARDGSRLREAGVPSDTVIFEGLPVRVDALEVRVIRRRYIERETHKAPYMLTKAHIQLRESIIRNCISDNFPLVDVRITYSKGKRRAFIQFEEIDDAAAFVNENFPKVLISLPHTTDEVPDGKISAYIHFAHRREDAESRASSSQWVCQPCGFNNYSSRTKCKRCGAFPSSSTMRLNLNPAADAADVPTQILVVYPLPAFVNEGMLATDIKKLELERVDPASQKQAPGSKLQSTAPADRAARTGARAGSLHRVFLMRDPHTEESVKYGFAEFWTLQDAVDAMAKIKLLPSFTVAACPVTVSHIHMGVFVPEDRDISPDTERFSFNPLFNTALRVRYRDLRAYPSQLLIAAEPPESIATDGEPKGSDQGSNKKLKKRKADDPLGAPVKRPVPAMAGHMAMWQKKHEEIHTNESDDKTAAVKQPPPPPKNSKAAPIKFSFTGASMQATDPPPPSTSPPAPPSPSTAPPPPPEEQNGDHESAGKPDVQTKDEKPITPYADREKLQCLLCMRKFKSLDELGRHENSQLHAEKLLNEQSIKNALERLAKRGIQPQQQTEAIEDAGSAAPKYRDRAKERREQWNQPKKPAPVPADKGASGSQKDQGKAPAQEKAPAQSKGAGMLAKMGWTTGSGLGANSEGRTESIVTHVYREGVGLGAEGADLGNAQTLGESRTLNNRKDYVNAVNDRARERFFTEFGEKKDEKDGEQNGEEKNGKED